MVGVAPVPPAPRDSRVPTPEEFEAQKAALLGAD